MSYLETAQALFVALGWNARILQDYPVLTCAVAVPNGSLDVFCHVHAELQRILFYVRPQNLEIPSERMPQVAEFLTRANYGLPIGNFEMDWEDGEINCKSSVQLPLQCLDTATLQPYLLAAVETVNHYLPGLRAVLAGEKTPATAIKTLEQPQAH
ncbi:MAG: YbjN domain-containing protein [Acidithiobacillus sp.]|nr:YbjN domain-containing protein [Acidithiobacillus sp.]